MGAISLLYHRDYQVREPVEIRIYPDSITILNYGGPDRSIKMESFEEGIIKPRRYRNRRLGDFLKELGHSLKNRKLQPMKQKGQTRKVKTKLQETILFI